LAKSVFIECPERALGKEVIKKTILTSARVGALGKELIKK